MLVLDSSGSMWPYEDGVKTLANSVVDQFVLSSDAARIGIVEFNGDATLVKPLTTDRSELSTGINSFQASGGTHISAGLEMACGLLHVPPPSPSPPRPPPPTSCIAPIQHPACHFCCCGGCMRGSWW